MIHALLALLVIHLGVDFVGWSLMGSQPAVTTSVSAGVTASDTTIPVSSVAGFPGAGWLYIRGEAMLYSATATTCPAPFAAEPACFTGVSRGSTMRHPVCLTPWLASKSGRQSPTWAK